jgi:arylsulfatase A-like enzyme
MKTSICLVLFLCLALSAHGEAARPNILWVSSEDHGPHMGCYGDGYASTPNVDRLAAKGMIYKRVWSCAPVCAPARTTVISGMYPPSTGSEHMRSLVAYPAGKKMFPQFLREAGYYCTNNSKEDYNLEKPGQVWDESSKNAHWRKRAAGQPFFAVFNSTKSHESQIRTRPHAAIHDPAKVRVPAYHPDTPEARQDWAQYYDRVSEADADAGKVIEELEKDGLAEDTIVFYWADHGSGMPRNKRMLSNSGLHVPMVVYFPEKWRGLAPPDYRAGASTDRLVSFVDFAPTILSLAGIQPPDWMQGHAFAGKFMASVQPYVYGFRGRMDERGELSRAVTDGRHVYVRNYRPDLPWGQHIEYMFQTPTTRVWKALFDTGKTNDAQSLFWRLKPSEELFDLKSDPDEVHNVAAAPENAEIKAKLRAAQQELARKIRDVGFLPEGERLARAQGQSLYDFGHESSRYAFERVFAMAELASSLQSEAMPELKKGLVDADSGVRYWAVLGLRMRGAQAVAGAMTELRAAMKDASPEVRIAAAQALAQFGGSSEAPAALAELVKLAPWGPNNVFVSMAALTALDALDPADVKPVLASANPGLTLSGPVPNARYSSYVPRLVEDLMEKLELPKPPAPKKASGQQ